MSYYTDTNLENMILKSMVDISNDKAIELYDEVLQEMPPQEVLSAASRGKTFGELTYKQLQYIVLGSKNVNAESRANANVIMINLLLGSKKVNRFLTNESLLKKLRMEIKQAYGNIETDKAEPVKKPIPDEKVAEVPFAIGSKNEVPIWKKQ